MKYAFKNFNQEHMARAKAISLPISFKQSVEICNFIRNKGVNDAKKVLNGVMTKKSIIPFKRFNSDMGHKKKIGPGRYPEKASNHIIKLLESAEANAQFKGLNTSDLMIINISANKASKTWHYGRKRRRKAKRTSIEIVVEERKKQQKNEEKKKHTGKQEGKKK